MTLPPSPERKRRLKAALDKLDFSPAREIFRQSAMDILLSIDSSGPGTAPAKYRTHRSRGQPKKLRAEAVAVIVAYAYVQSTGKQPKMTIPTTSDDLTPTGPFFTLLADVFDALGLRESAEHQAKNICINYPEVSPLALE